MGEQNDRERDDSQRPWGTTVKGETGQYTDQGQGEEGVAGASFAGTPAGPAETAAQGAGSGDAGSGLGKRENRKTDEGSDPSPS
jgi:hypothetical protein